MPQRFNPRPITPNEDQALRPNALPGQSLVEQLGSTADELRQLYTEFGLRPYRVFSVIIRWTGGASGRGDAVLEQETELLPTPLVRDTKTIRGVAKPAGLDEEGSITLRQISPRYTEDDIRSIFHQQPLPDDRDGFLEVRIDERDGSTKRRRFSVKGAPYRDAGKFEWSASLRLQSHDRGRDGEIRDDIASPAEVQFHTLSKGT